MKKIIQILILILCFQKIQSQDLRSAYLQYKWVSGNTYIFELKLYCESSKNIARPTASLNFGDATGGNLTLYKSFTDNGITAKTYSISHTYSGNGQYYPVFQDTFRIINIKNIVNSQTQAITSEAYINIGPLTGHSTAPFLQNHPIYFQLNGNDVCYDPNFYDVDGDSLSFLLANCCTVGYYIPTGTALSYSGTLCFNKDSIGIYSFAYLVREWRKDANNNYFIIGHAQVDFAMNITNDVGSEEIKSQSNIVIYPNPVSDILSITGNLKSGNIEILNILGQSVLKSPSTNKIDVSHLPPGTYFIKTNSSYSKFVKE